MNELDKYLSDQAIEFTNTPFLVNNQKMRETYVRAFVTGRVKTSTFIKQKACEWLALNMCSGEYIGINDSISKIEFINKFMNYLEEEL